MSISAYCHTFHYPIHSLSVTLAHPSSRIQDQHSTKSDGIGTVVAGVGIPFMMIHVALDSMIKPSVAFQLTPHVIPLTGYIRQRHTYSNHLHLGTKGGFQSRGSSGVSTVCRQTSPQDSVSQNDIGDEEVQEDCSNSNDNHNTIQHEWRNFLDGVRQPLSAKQNQQNSRYDPLMGYSYEDLNAFADASSSSNDRKLLMDNFPQSHTLEDDPLDADAIFLEPDAYIQLSRDSFHLNNPDYMDTDPYNEKEIRSYGPMQGYLETISTIPNDSNSFINMDFMNDSRTVDDVWSMIGALQQRHRDSSSSNLSDDMHLQIFQNESGFFNQSDIFLESLTNISKATEASVERRGRRYRSRQQEAIASLNQQIEEMEDLLLNQHQIPNSTTLRCCQCDSILSDEELRKVNSSTQMSGNPICRVCHMDELLANSKRIETERMNQRHERARTILQSYRQTGFIPQIITNLSAARSHRNVTPSGNNKQQSLSSINSDLQQSFSDVESSTSRNSDNESNSSQVSSTPNNDAAMCLSTSFQNMTVNHVQGVETTMISESIHPWIEMNDPDTNEIFYWNEETEEMRWEL